MEAAFCLLLYCLNDCYKCHIYLSLFSSFPNNKQHTLFFWMIWKPVRSLWGLGGCPGALRARVRGKPSRMKPLLQSWAARVCATLVCLSLSLRLSSLCRMPYTFLPLPVLRHLHLACRKTDETYVARLSGQEGYPT